jgi:hypothetical protein
VQFPAGFGPGDGGDVEAEPLVRIVLGAERDRAVEPRAGVVVALRLEYPQPEIVNLAPLADSRS